MSVEFDRGSPGKFDSRTLSRETLSRWTGRITMTTTSIVIVILIVLNFKGWEFSCLICNTIRYTTSML